VRRLQREDYANILVRTRGELDLRNGDSVGQFFREEHPDYVFLAAAKVGGILANSRYPADFIRENLQIQTNVIDAAYRGGVKKLLFLGSSCIYPRTAPQPMREEYLLTGALEPTNAEYAIAKIAGIKMCQAYRAQYGFRAIAVAPTNLYGPNDNFELESSHVLAALLRKFHEAKTAGGSKVVVWGTGTPRREFMHVDDLADACLHLMRAYEDPAIINIGVGEDISIRELAELIGRIAGFSGSIVYDDTKPDGMPRKLLDISRLKRQGWAPKIPLEDGIRQTYQWYWNTLMEHSVPDSSSCTA
jgi:GDP-L-fucose synthase